MTIEEGTNQKNHRVLKIGIFAVSLAAIVLSAFFLVNPKYSEPFSLTWDGGEWSDPLAVNCNSPSIVEFKSKLYMFYSVVTENTIGDDDVVIKPQEHLLYDVLYRVFDGTNFSEPITLSSPTDKISVSGRYFVFKDELYVVLSEWWISNYTSYETESKVHLEVFDGNNWHQEQWPFVDDAYEFHDLKYFVYADKVWAVWQYIDKPVAGHFSNVFGFRTFDGKAWSETRNLPIRLQRLMIGG